MSGKKAGEEEESVRKLTTSSNRAEKGLKVGLDERRPSSVRTTMVAGDDGLDWAARRLNRARGGATEVEGEVARLGAR